MSQMPFVFLFFFCLTSILCFSCCNLALFQMGGEGKVVYLKGLCFQASFVLCKREKRVPLSEVCVLSKIQIQAIFISYA